MLLADCLTRRWLGTPSSRTACARYRSCGARLLMGRTDKRDLCAFGLFLSCVSASSLARRATRRKPIWRPLCRCPSKARCPSAPRPRRTSGLGRASSPRLSVSLSRCENQGCDVPFFCSPSCLFYASRPCARFSGATTKAAAAGRAAP